ncbi:MAG: alpha/beta fold hydrolase [Deltaproteobacteria bacterium]|nr:alpha/beta fold hydrolase [Deltaproteobacteria bacterium]
MAPRVLYLHGFASGPGSSKGAWLARALSARGYLLEQPDLNVPTFEALDVRAMLATVTDALARDGRPAVLVGSSLGGFVAALAATRAPTVASALLLAPSFDTARRWRAALDDEAWAQWQREGSRPYPHYNRKVTLPLHAGFLGTFEGLPAMPPVPCPVTVIQGLDDALVPPSLVRRWASENPHARLLEVPDDHQLLRSLDLVRDEALALLAAVEAQA